jgi:hypothetical protein
LNQGCWEDDRQAWKDKSTKKSTSGSSVGDLRHREQEMLAKREKQRQRARREMEVAQ